MKTFLVIMQIVTSIVLIGSVLLQSGKSAGLSGSIAGGAEQMMGTKGRGLDSVFAKITSGCAILFIICAVGLLVIQG
ncbi:preprotein translocase subunit SecG [Peptostreptococcaceae bacterium AGR-M142]